MGFIEEKKKKKKKEKVNTFRKERVVRKDDFPFARGGLESVREPLLVLV
jgi:hypothetical protein